MSATSMTSWEPDCDDWGYYHSSNLIENSYEAMRRPGPTTPFYQTMGQPLIYYAGVKPWSRKQSDRPHQTDGRNCFAKAFKWYTQEREPENRRISPELSGFATWLDSKYVEYLQDVEMKEEVLSPHQQETYTVVEQSCPPCRTDEASKPKRFSRMRSPWSKRRCQNRNDGDVPGKKPTESCEFLLQPKDLELPASECCYTAPASCLKNSNSTAKFSEVEEKIEVMSQSKTTICYETITQNCKDVITENDDTSDNKVPKTNDCCEKSERMKEINQWLQSKLSSCDPSCTSRLEQVARTHTPEKSQRSIEKSQNKDLLCDPSCKYQQENNSTTKNIRHKHSKLETIEYICDPNCTYRQANKATLENRENVGNTQEKKCDPNCTYDQGSKANLRKKQLPPNAAQKQDNVGRATTHEKTQFCDPSCTLIPKTVTKITEGSVQKHDSENTQEKKLSCAPSCSFVKENITNGKGTDGHESATQNEQDSTNTPQTKFCCNPSCNQQPQYKNVEEKQESSAKPQEKTFASNPIFTYIIENTTISKTENVPPIIQKTEVPLTLKCMDQQEKPCYLCCTCKRDVQQDHSTSLKHEVLRVASYTNQRTVLLASPKTQNKEFHRDLGCTCQHNEPRTPPKQQMIDMPLHPTSFTYQREEQPRCTNQHDIDLAPPALQYNDIPCDYNCTCQHDKLSAPLKVQNKEIPTDQECTNQHEIKDVRPKLLNKEKPCDPTCTYQYKVQLAAPKLQNHNITCDPNCKDQREVQLASPKTQRNDLICDPKYKQPRFASPKSQKNEICNSNQSYSYKEQSPFQAQLKDDQHEVKLTKSVKNELCDSSCTYQHQEYPIATKVQITVTPCDPNCKSQYTGQSASPRLRQEEISSDPNCVLPSGIQFDSQKPQYKDIPCDPTCTFPRKIQVGPNKPQHKVVPCNPSYTYKNERQHASFRQPHKDISCEASSTFPSEVQPDFHKIQPNEIACDPNCTSPRTVLLASHTPQHQEVPCEPSCTFSREVQAASNKSQHKDIPCDSNFTFPHKSQLISQRYEQYKEILFDPSWMYQYEVKQTSPQLQNKDELCDLNCTSNSIRKTEAEKYNKQVYDVTNVFQGCTCTDSDDAVDAQVFIGVRQTFEPPMTVKMEQSADPLGINELSTSPKIPLRVETNVKIENKSSSIYWDPKKQERGVKTSEVPCQCSAESIIKLEVSCQYDANDFKPYSASIIAIVKSEKSCINRNRHGTISNLTRSEGGAKLFPQTEYRNDGVQTSNHSINFENDGRQKYALFMKVVCADKLNDCNCDK